MINDHIKHYGVKGMRWGVTTEEYSTSNRPSGSGNPGAFNRPRMSAEEISRTYGVSIEEAHKMVQAQQARETSAQKEVLEKAKTSGTVSPARVKEMEKLAADEEENKKKKLKDIKEGKKGGGGGAEKKVDEILKRTGENAPPEPKYREIYNNLLQSMGANGLVSRASILAQWYASTKYGS